MSERVPVAIVTGASSGIGRATAQRLAREGFDVGLTFANDRPGSLVTAESVRALGRRTTIARLDLRDPEAATAAIDDLVLALGAVDVLINNAGLNRRCAALEESVEGWEETLAVNLVGPWACARAAARHMIERGGGGRIVNITSVLAFAALEGGAAYCAAKSAVEALTKVLALEWAPYAILVNSVAPGHTATPMNYAAHELEHTVIERPVVPLGRAATAEEVATAVAQLASPDSSYITGASLLVDGGLLLQSGPQALQRATGLPPERTAAGR
jgi:NAD(P)-dependent dehydrogenase (short-subunit alcohol dehydrogenase family)